MTETSLKLIIWLLVLLIAIKLLAPYVH